MQYLDDGDEPPPAWQLTTDAGIGAVRAHLTVASVPTAESVMGRGGRQPATAMSTTSGRARYGFSHSERAQRRLGTDLAVPLLREAADRRIID